MIAPLKNIYSKGKIAIQNIVAKNPNAIGIALVMLASFWSTGLGVAMRLTMEMGYHSSQVAFLRGVGGILCCLPILYSITRQSTAQQSKKSNIWDMLLPDRSARTLWLLLARSIAVGFAISLFTFALAHMPMAELISTTFMTPIIMTIAAAVIFKESVGIRRMTAVVVGFIGAYLLLDPQNSGMSVGKWSALAVVMFSSATIILGKMLSKSTPITILVLFATIGMTVVAGTLSIPHWQPLNLTAYAMIIVMGLLGNLGQWSFTKGVDIGEISVIMPFDYIRLLYGALAGYFIFAEIPSGNLWTGSALIIAAALYTSMRERKRNRTTTPPKPPVN